jgi:deoxyuridine 5'-triphosphate nucleotidohydrolase
MKQIEVYKLDNRATLPTRNNPNDAALDLYALEDVFLPLHSTTMIKTGIAVHIPPGYVGMLKERSGVGKKGLKVTGGVIDAGYCGDISILVMNISNKDDGALGYQVKAGDRLAQLLIIPIETPEVIEVDTLWTSERGNKGFNSSGR